MPDSTSKPCASSPAIWRMRSASSSRTGGGSSPSQASSSSSNVTAETLGAQDAASLVGDLHVLAGAHDERLHISGVGRDVTVVLAARVGSLVDGDAQKAQTGSGAAADLGRVLPHPAGEH